MANEGDTINMATLGALPANGGTPQGRRAVDRRRVGKDMAPGEMSTLRKLFAKFLGEEAQEPEHRTAADSMDAAGVIVRAPNGDCLFVKRSTAGDHAGEWAFPGGKVEDGETHVGAARRELKEETGYDAARLHSFPRDVSLKVAGDSKVRFATFLHHANDAFSPKLNGEHTHFKWAKPSEAPEPLHPGVKALLSSDRIKEVLAMDPLTSKGREIMENMRKQYGEEKGEGVFYASAKKGTITGVEGHDQAMATSPEGGMPQGHWTETRRDIPERFLDGATSGSQHQGSWKDPARLDTVKNRVQSYPDPQQWNATPGGAWSDEAVDGYDPGERRDPAGKWTAGGGMSGGGMRVKGPIGRAEHERNIRRDRRPDHEIARSYGITVKEVGRIKATPAFSPYVREPVHPSKRINPGKTGQGEDCVGTDCDCAQDTIVAFDEAMQRKKDIDGRLHVAMTPISKAVVNPYLGKEIPRWQEMGLDPEKTYHLYRHPDELRKAAATSNGMPLFLKHKETSAGDHKKDLVIGATGSDGTFKDPLLLNYLVVWPQEYIDAIENNKQRELSASYHYDADMRPGVAPDGTPYDGVMRNIKFNHIALVKEGRAGHDVKVADGADEFYWARIEAAIASSRSGAWV